MTTGIITRPAFYRSFFTSAYLRIYVTAEPGCYGSNSSISPFLDFGLILSSRVLSIVEQKRASYPRSRRLVSKNPHVREERASIRRRRYVTIVKLKFIYCFPHFMLKYVGRDLLFKKEIFLLMTQEEISFELLDVLAHDARYDFADNLLKHTPSLCISRSSPIKKNRKNMPQFV